MIAIAAGTGVGVNALVSKALGEKDKELTNRTAINDIIVYRKSLTFREDYDRFSLIWKVDQR